jgi:Icc-related predicted phosphoesterase
LFTSDLHGQSSLYEQLLALVATRRPGAVILGGDLAPHEAGETGVRRQRVFLEGFFVEFARRLEEASPATTLAVLMGNDDWAANADCLESRHGELWQYLHGRSVEIGGHAVAGSSWVPITPFAMKDWERWDDGAEEPAPRLDGWVSGPRGLEAHAFDPAHRSPTIAEALEALRPLSEPSRTMYVTHTPPRDTLCDVIASRSHVGSRAWRRFIEEHQPPLVLSGHIHESPRVSASFRDRVGRTAVTNPGQFGTSRLCAVWFDPDDADRTLRHSVWSE